MKDIRIRKRVKYLRKNMDKYLRAISHHKTYTHREFRGELI